MIPRKARQLLQLITVLLVVIAVVGGLMLSQIYQDIKYKLAEGDLKTTFKIYSRAFELKNGILKEDLLTLLAGLQFQERSANEPLSLGEFKTLDSQECSDFYDLSQWETPPTCVEIKTETEWIPQNKLLLFSI